MLLPITDGEKGADITFFYGRAGECSLIPHRLTEVIVDQPKLYVPTMDGYAHLVPNIVEVVQQFERWKGGIGIFNEFLVEDAEKGYIREFVVKYYPNAYIRSDREMRWQ